MRHIPPAISCPVGCGSVLQLSTFFPRPYFEGREAKCSSCGMSFDLWEHAIELLRKNAQLFRNKGAAFIGGREVYFTFQLPPSQTVEVDLTKYGVPEDSKLLYVVYTPTLGAGWPLELRGNQPLQHQTTHKILFYGRPFPNDGGEECGKHDVDMSVTYIPKAPSQLYFEHLADAYEYFLADNYERMILPSAVALEYAIERMTADVLSELRLPESLNPTKRLSLEVIIPLVCRLHGIPTLDARIVDVTSKLWGLRNQMAHEGVLKQPLGLGGASQFLAAAMFTLNYLVFVVDTLRERLNKC